MVTAQFSTIDIVMMHRRSQYRFEFFVHGVTVSIPYPPRGVATSKIMGEGLEKSKVPEKYSHTKLRKQKMHWFVMSGSLFNQFNHVSHNRINFL